MASSSAPPPQMVYAAILHNTTILSEHIAHSSSQTSLILPKILPQLSHTHPTRHRKFTAGPLTIYALVRHASDSPAPPSSADALSFLLFSTKDLGDRFPFGFLASVEQKFLAEFEPGSTNFAALDTFGCASFNGALKRMMTTEAGKQDAVRAAESEIEQVTDIMRRNVEAALERGGQIEGLVDKTDRLGTNARDFRVRSRGLRRRMWFKNFKLMLLLAVVVFFLMYLFVGMICGLPGWGRCVGR